MSVSRVVLTRVIGALVAWQAGHRVGRVVRDVRVLMAADTPSVLNPTR